ncbi:MAG: polyribonucleotide nucleotidyltransferase [Candidatus Doudnabacteria bacterium RIFCSPLOWO2_02_FULL_42_9]|uniref:Polyribonucleotide nucleotidyltransferase n=1 Tax=Candidatus Doudnabacteria bacterium RIFCSPHIGHO2_01_FULL_41_86 TaxID=1817821 RepID=A0A1F5N9L9_9BACT|nr:MAG: polyribonucleotide nucleotidyltransferase [Candidatus Doudnabacteria bacterium RIFCSPHIGHO2_01_FULL_41_86]OGE75081.1 MAG: polyribonucleotide nucleotidyltransferase [Candidatus Doudnabacteria bacterium RIFCSPHIGHO2_01_43_10]OGE85333.1 MAG: polyribonucleotide nucleotidyltransferase [Candidatus Doudnabacteria bacterium RIFCSPHIGHO2_12_FULL_42_22]OGE86871.1 MAG: polyribonucleotide nucleotidyltransferase [Candidatus Doudnabacteria bacterium RIFCSPHIGHO2_02_FULL_42_25]OGE92470.1 MAG: polyribo
MGIGKVESDISGKKLSLETGVLAKQANGSVLAKLGDTVVLATAVMGKIKDGMDYFPLMVDYEERLYAAGKIKGSRFIKREGRATDEAILSGRLIDRSIRPLFPDGMRNEVQVVATILSVDEINDPDILAINAASTALSISNIPFEGPIAAVRVGRVNNEFVINPSYDERKNGDLDLVVSGTGEHIMMVEAGAGQVTEEDMTEALKFAMPHLKALIDLQNNLQKQVGEAKAEVVLLAVDAGVMKKVEGYTEKIETALYGTFPKEQRETNLDTVREQIEKEVAEAFAGNTELDAAKHILLAFEKLLKKIIRKNILDHEKRVDMRPLNKTREVSAQVGVLPRTHGSALFNRGETQVLTTVTLGSAGDAQILDGMEDFNAEGTTKRYIHHYNFPGFSVGEVAPIRGPGRREVGHGALAERAVEVVIPEKEKFPYTLRLVSEVLSSNGSTSMASTCGSTLALMDAGVPIEAIIGGVAMGLVLDKESGNFKVLTDIQGIEDANGDMDFKVTGSEKGITALQMDIKAKGLTVEIMEKALIQAKEGRMHIISVMKSAIAEPRTEMSPLAPRIVTMQINPDKIRDVIGTGGKIINKIIAETGVKIDIEDSGLVMVASNDAEGMKKALKWIEDLTREIKVGEVFKGKVSRIMDFGAFVELVPGHEGLVHISELEWHRVGRVEDVVNVGDEIEVKVIEIDHMGRVNLSRKILLSKPEGGTFDDRPRPPRDNGHGGPRHNGGGRHLARH